MAAIVSAPTVAARTMAVATMDVTTMAVATVAVTTVVLLAVGLLTRCASPERVEEYRSEAAAAANAVPVWVEGCHLALQAIVSVALVSVAIVSTAMVGGGWPPQRCRLAVGLCSLWSCILWLELCTHCGYTCSGAAGQPADRRW